MQSWLRSGAAAAVLGALAAPAMAQVEFHGGGFLSDFSSACAADGWGGVQQVVVRLRPANEGGNPNFNVANLFLDAYTLHFRFPAASLNTWVNVTEATTIGGTFGTQTNPRPRIRLLPPPSGTAWGDSERHLIAEIDHFSHLANCGAAQPLAVPSLRRGTAPLGPGRLPFHRSFA